MIPDFDDDGYLPPGIHEATLDEIETRFGAESEVRRTQFQSMCWLIDLAKAAKARRLIINGSFTTDRYEPNDIDCVLLIDADYDSESPAGVEIADGLPFLTIELAGEDVFRYMAESCFASDRFGKPKGVVEVVL
jgi:hypothetical protein